MEKRFERDAPNCRDAFTGRRRNHTSTHDVESKVWGKGVFVFENTIETRLVSGSLSVYFNSVKRIDTVPLDFVVWLNESLKET